MWNRGQITDFRVGDEVLVHLPSPPEEPLTFPAVVVAWDEIELDPDGVPINVVGCETTDRRTMVPVKWANYGWYDLPDKADVTLIARARTFRRPNFAGGSGDGPLVAMIAVPPGDFADVVPLAQTVYQPGVSLTDHFPTSIYAEVLGTLDLVLVTPATKALLDPAVQTGTFQAVSRGVQRALSFDLSAWELVGRAGDFYDQALTAVNHPASVITESLVFGPVVLVYRLAAPRPNRTARAEVYAIPSRRAWPIGDKRHALLAIRYMEARFGDPADYPQIIAAIQERWGSDPAVTAELRAFRRGAVAYRDALEVTGSREDAKQAGRRARRRSRAR